MFRGTFRPRRLLRPLIGFSWVLFLVLMKMIPCPGMASRRSLVGRMIPCPQFGKEVGGCVGRNKGLCGVYRCRARLGVRRRVHTLRCCSPLHSKNCSPSSEKVPPSPAFPSARPATREQCPPWQCPLAFRESYRPRCSPVPSDPSRRPDEGVGCRVGPRWSGQSCSARTW